jgi:formate dehydrogenase subunit gamma
MSEQLTRHTRPGIYIHWFNAAAWLFLMTTGLGLIDRPELGLLGPGYAKALRNIFGGGAVLLWTHVAVGLAWLAVWTLFIVTRWKTHVVPFLKQIATFDLPRDIHWLVKKQFQMVLGHRVMARLVRPLGWDGRIPNQDYYNAGQKAAALPLVLGGLTLAATGLLMALSKYRIDPGQVFWVQWSILVHYLAAAGTLAVLLIHVYMSSLAREERPALWSMFTGTVPAEYARHHHLDWHLRLQRQKINDFQNKEE